MPPAPRAKEQARKLTEDECRGYVRSLRLLRKGEELALQILAAALVEAPLPAPWRLRRDSADRAYFEDYANRTSTRAHPLEASLRELVHLLRACLALRPEHRESEALRLQRQWEEELKVELQGWYCAKAENGREYYCHRSTGETSWNHPVNSAVPYYIKFLAMKELRARGGPAGAPGSSSHAPAPPAESGGDQELRATGGPAEAPGSSSLAPARLAESGGAQVEEAGGAGPEAGGAGLSADGLVDALLSELSEVRRPLEGQVVKQPVEVPGRGDLQAQAKEILQQRPVPVAASETQLRSSSKQQVQVLQQRYESEREREELIKSIADLSPVPPAVQRRLASPAASVPDDGAWRQQQHYAGQALRGGASVLSAASDNAPAAFDLEDTGSAAVGRPVAALPPPAAPAAALGAAGSGCRTLAFAAAGASSASRRAAAPTSRCGALLAGGDGERLLRDSSSFSLSRAGRWCLDPHAAPSPSGGLLGGLSCGAHVASAANLRLSKQGASGLAPEAAAGFPNAPEVRCLRSTASTGALLWQQGAGR